MAPTRDFRFTPEPYQPRITHRPLKKESPTMRDTIEEHYLREQRQLDRRLAKYRVKAEEQFHNTRPLERGMTFWDNFKIVDRGKGRYEPAQEYQPLNPILNTLDNYPKPPPSRKFAPLWRSLAKRAFRGRVRREVVEDNPVKAPWNEAAVLKADPIISRTSSAVPYSAATPTRNGRDRYGSYDPILCDWILEPEDAERRDAAGYVPLKGRQHVGGWEENRPKSANDALCARRSRKRTPLPAEQGVYDPIKNCWLVLPENKRICEGQSFAPVTKHHFR